MFDTTDLIKLNHAQIIAFDEMQESVKMKSEIMRLYCQKEGANKDYVERERKFIAAVVDYVNITEAYIEQVKLKMAERDKTLAEALEILTLTQTEVEKTLNGIRNT